MLSLKGESPAIFGGKSKILPTVRLFFRQIRLLGRMRLLSIRQFRLNKLACVLAPQGTSERLDITQVYLESSIDSC